MATLNIKNFPGALYRRLKERARRERRSVAQEVTHLLERALDEPEPLSILDLEGLGEELWEGDAAAHVARGRESWDWGRRSRRGRSPSTPSSSSISWSGASGTWTPCAR